MHLNFRAAEFARKVKHKVKRPKKSRNVFVDSTDFFQYNNYPALPTDRAHGASRTPSSRADSFSSGERSWSDQSGVSWAPWDDWLALGKGKIYVLPAQKPTSRSKLLSVSPVVYSNSSQYPSLKWNEYLTIFNNIEHQLWSLSPKGASRPALKSRRA